MATIYIAVSRNKLVIFILRLNCVNILRTSEEYDLRLINSEVQSSKRKEDKSIVENCTPFFIFRSSISFPFLEIRVSEVLLFFFFLSYYLYTGGNRAVYRKRYNVVYRMFGRRYIKTRVQWNSIIEHHLTQKKKIINNKNLLFYPICFTWRNCFHVCE